ncbi:DMT family transporter [bacterium]|nr:DMT family transporter [bacterium]
MRYMISAAVFFSMMGLFVRLVRDIPFLEVVVFRALVSLVISAALLLRAGKSLWGKNKGLLFLRGLFGFLGLSAYFYTIHAMPLAEAVTIQYTNPLFTALFAPFILKERTHGSEWLAGLLAFGGVLLIAQPTSVSAVLPALIGLGGAMCSGLAYNIVRKLGMEGEDPLTIVMYFPLIAVILAAPLAATSWRMPVGMEWLILLGVGVTTQIAQVSMTKGLRLERAARATVVNYFVIFLSTMYSLLLGESLTIYSFLGMAAIIAGITVLSGWRPSRLRRAR